ncbi:MAG: ComF family protein [Verrucomicrobiae bacterium]|nr:ComF family protein [Verrucomicrobiae bacterium]
MALGETPKSHGLIASARSLIEGTLGLVYPRNCVGCDEVLGADGRRWLCLSCEAKLHRIEPPYCSICGQTYEGAMPDNVRCGNCSDLDLAFDFAVGAYRNEGLARELVHRFKYEREHHLCAPLGRLLADALKEDRLARSDDEWLVVPVPLHPKRLRERQFNQAAELSRILRRTAAESGVLLTLVDVLRRTRYTRRQASLDRAWRLTNLRGAFALSRRRKTRARLEDSSILLVDDVLTTGATANECARVLRQEGGAAKIVVITAVRG